MDGPDSEAEMRRALEAISAALPAQAKPALSILLAATAARAIDAGLSDAQAVDGFISTLGNLRREIKRERMN